eukprot:869633-Alexandrium_andersonii.AAC.1
MSASLVGSEMCIRDSKKFVTPDKKTHPPRTPTKGKAKAEAQLEPAPPAEADGDGAPAAAGRRRGPARPAANRRTGALPCMICETPGSKR